MYSFQIGHNYRRRDIYRIIGIPEDTRGGNWDTGYNSHGNDWFIFCNVGTSGRTGHDYANQWIGNKLEWYGKTKSKLYHSSIQSMLNTNTYVFWREKNVEPFIFAGIGSAEKVEDTIPVKIVWAFQTVTFPDEIHLVRGLKEGLVSKVLVNNYERNPLARKRCIEYYGSSCYVCGFNFGKVFGEVGEGLIHIHHLVPLSNINEEYEVDPVRDLRPVCPNCHALIHRIHPPLSIESVKLLLE